MTKLTQARLKEVLDYNPETGVFTTLARRRKKAGVAAGRPHHSGYIFIGIDYKTYLAHRLAFLFMTGDFPAEEVDHIDLDKANNKWSNLRIATSSQNKANTAPRGVVRLKGVTRNGKKYKALIRINGQPTYLGTFASAEEAHSAYAHRANDHFGQYARLK